MVVHVSPRVEAEIEWLVSSGQCADANAVIDEGLRLLVEREQARFLRLRELVRAGFNSGEPIELTDDLWDEIDRDADEAAQRGDIPSPHVCP